MLVLLATFALAGCSEADDAAGTSAPYLALPEERPYTPPPPPPPPLPPGGFVSITVDDADGALSSNTFAEFYSEFSGEFRTYADVPIDECVDALAPLGGEPLSYLDVGPVVTASSAGVTLTLTRATVGNEIRYELPSNVPATIGVYTVVTSSGLIGSITLPSLPQPVSVTGTELTWTAMGADRALAIVGNSTFSQIFICSTADDGAYDFAPLGLTSGATNIIGVNYVSVEFQGRNVLLSGVANDLFDLISFGP